METGRGRSALRWLAGVAILLAAVAPLAGRGALAQEGGQAELETAALAPADSLAFVSLNTDPGSEQWGLAADLLGQAGLEDAVYGTVADLFSETGLPAEWITPGSSLLGDEVSVAVVAGGPEVGPLPVVILSTDSPNQAFETARNAFEAAFPPDEGFVGLPVVEEEGVTLLSSYYGDAALARVDDLIVVGPGLGVQQAVGVAYGAEPSLASREAFSELVDDLEEDRILTAWTNGPALAGAQGAVLADPSAVGLGFQEAALLSPALGQAGSGYAAVGMWAEEEGFRLDARVLPGPRDPALTAPDDATDLAERAPADALVFVDGVDLGQLPALRGYVDAIAYAVGLEAAFEADEDGTFDQPPLEESYAALDEILGFDVRAELLDLLVGDYGMWLSSSSLEETDDLAAVVAVDVSDAATVDASVDRLLTLLRLGADGELTVNATRVGDAPVTEILVPDGGSGGVVRVTVGVVGEQLLIGVGSGLEEYLDGPPEEALADAPRFEAALDALPDDDGGRLYLDVSAVLAMAAEESEAVGNTDDAARLEALEGIQALAAVTRMDDEVQVTSVVLTIDEGAADREADEGAADPGEASPEPGASPVATGGLAVTEVERFETEGRLLSLSPADGAMLTLDVEADEVCVVAVSGEVEGCGGPVSSVDPQHAAWSPDGRRVAFTEDAARFFDDADVLVFDRDAGELQNWTDDGYDGGIISLSGDEEVPSSVAVDQTPAWTPDGEGLVFARTVFNESETYTTILYRVDGPGQEPDAVAPAGLYPFATYLGIEYAEDGRLVYSSSSTDRYDPANGLYELSADGRSARQVLSAPGELGPPSLLGVTSSGSALVAYPYYASLLPDQGPEGICALQLVDLATTARTPLRMPDGTCAGFAGLTADGSSVVLLRSKTVEGGEVPLAVLDAADPGRGPVAVDVSAFPSEGTTEGGELGGTYGREDLGVTVLADGRIVLMESPYAGVLLTIG